MSTDHPRPPEPLLPLLVLAAVVAIVSTGLAHGLWLPNVHNGLLALAFAGASAWTLLVRPRHRGAVQLAVVGVLEAVLFVGRQLAHGSTGDDGAWWGWFGTWPLALVLGALTWAVLCFPEGRFLSRGWRRVGVVVAVVAAMLALVSALWPVEQASAGLGTPPPFALAGEDVARRIWDAVAHPVYAALQLLWVVAVWARWRRAHGVLRTQLAVLGAAVGLAALALVVGLAVWQSPRLGLVVTPLVPVAAGWSMVRLSLGRVVEESRAVGGLAGLSPRENDVLDLMAQGLSNKAIAERLHLSIKTVEPVVGSIFTKLRLPADAATNRRVLAVLALTRQ